MDLTTAINNYQTSGNFFAPDYEQDNDVLYQFKKESATLSNAQIGELRNILQNSSNLVERIFVADLLYLYSSFDIELVDPLLENAIGYKDPSFNRIFLRPALRVYGAATISEMLAKKFVESDVIRKMQIASLVYWIQRDDDSPIKKLEDVIVQRAKNTNNVIELYYYNRYFPDQVQSEERIPNNANELMAIVNGNPDLEEILYEKLGWSKTNAS